MYSKFIKLIVLVSLLVCCGFAGRVLYGHLSQECRTRGRSTSQGCKVKNRETQSSRPLVNYVEGIDGDSDDYLGSLEVNYIGGKDRLIWVTPEIHVQGRVIKLELDTRSVSALPYEWHKEDFGHEKLAKSHITLKTYNG